MKKALILLVAPLVIVLGLTFDAIQPAAYGQLVLKKGAPVTYTANWRAGLARWSSAGSGHWTVQGGALTFDGAGKSTIVAPYRPSRSSYYIQARIQLTIHARSPVTNGTDAFGILFRASNAYSPTNVFPICPGTGAGYRDERGFGRHKEGRWITIMDACAYGGVGPHRVAFWPSKQAHVYRLEVRGIAFTISVDGHLMVSESNRFLGSGHADVGLFSLSDGIRVYSFQAGPLL